MKLSIIIPAFNEENTIEEIIKRVENISLPIEKEIIVINDGSSDGTNKKLGQLKEEFNFILIEHKQNQGKGMAIRTCLSKATGDFVLIQDADLEYDPIDYQRLLDCALKNNAEVVYGSRNLNSKNKFSHLSFYLGGMVLTWMVNLLYGINITDEATCYKMFKTELLRSLNLICKRFEFCTEVTVKIAKRGIKIYEVPINYFPRHKKEGKKIKWKDGFLAAWILIKYKFVD